MNKADLIDALAPRLGGRAAATLAVEAFADAVMRQVAAGGSVGISGFGTFERVERAPRTGRNPRTGEAVPIKATISPRFRPGAYFKDVVTDPAKLPKDGLAGARVGSDGMAPTRSGAPTSVRRSAQPDGTDAKGRGDEGAGTGTGRSGSRSRRSSVGGTPSTVRANRPAEQDGAGSRAGAEPAGTGMPVLGGEEITQEILRTKKAQLARVKDDVVAGKRSKDGKKDKKSGKKDKKSKMDKGDKAGRSAKKDGKDGKKDKKSKKGKGKS